MALVVTQTTANENPDSGQAGAVAVSSASNTGHGSTTASAAGANEQTKACRWSGFATVAGTITSVTLKADWIQNGSLSDGGVSTSNQFDIEYSLNGGSTWNTLKTASQIQASSSGTSSQSLLTSQDLTQVQARDTLFAAGVIGENASVTATVSNIRIEVTTTDTSANFPPVFW